MRDIRAVLNTGVTAIIDFAIEESIPELPRTTNYCRFTITDDGENDPATLAAAISTAGQFLAGSHTVAICCNAGINRSPSVAAVVLANLDGTTPSAALEKISGLKRIDVNPALWHQLVTVNAELSSLPDTER